MPSTAGRTPVLRIIVDVFETPPAHCRADAGLAPIRNVHRRAQKKALNQLVQGEKTRSQESDFTYSYMKPVLCSVEASRLEGAYVHTSRMSPEVRSFGRDRAENKKLQNARASQSNVYKRRASALHSYLLSSRLYCRLRSFTESCLTARGLYHR